ncbi:MAG: AMP-binding protein, partial [Methylocystis sp.]
MIDVRFASPFLTEDDLDRPSLRDDRGTAVTYGALRDRVADYSTAMAGSKSLVFLYARNDIASVAALLGAFAAGHAVALLDPELSKELRETPTTRYQPEWVIGAEASGELDRRQGGGGEINPALALLLSTSGSTGSPKFVRLSLEALESNARAIASTLDIASEDVAAAHLPVHYSFGLSVLTSHLIAGASLRLTQTGFTDRGFWSAMKEASVTHLPGVPFHFQMMQKLRYERLGLTQLKSLAQA